MQDGLVHSHALAIVIISVLLYIDPSVRSWPAAFALISWCCTCITLPQANRPQRIEWFNRLQVFRDIF